MTEHNWDTLHILQNYPRRKLTVGRIYNKHVYNIHVDSTIADSYRMINKKTIQLYKFALAVSACIL